jgi:hypothetical protein
MRMWPTPIHAYGWMNTQVCISGSFLCAFRWSGIKQSAPRPTCASKQHVYVTSTPAQCYTCTMQTYPPVVCAFFILENRAAWSLLMIAGVSSCTQAIWLQDIHVHVYGCCSARGNTCKNSVNMVYIQHIYVNVIHECECQEIIYIYESYTTKYSINLHK